MAEKEYIERDTLNNDLDWFAPEAFNALIDKINKIIRNQPTADVQEVRHGRWLPKHYEGGLLGGSNVDECSECGYERLIRDMKYRTVYKYCPNCGAKMDMDKE